MASILDTLRKSFKLFVKKGGKEGTKELQPGKINKKTGKVDQSPFFKSANKTGTHSGLMDWKQIWDWWTSNNFDSPSNFLNRKNRYDDLKFAAYNDPIMAQGVDMLADEAVQVNSQDRPIEVEAKNKKFEKAINDFFDDIGLTPATLRVIAYNLALYGDAFFVNSLQVGRGVEKILPVSVYNVIDRIEFNLAQATEQFSSSRGLYNSLYSRNNSIKKLFDVITTENKNSDIAEMFETYNFGYQMSGEVFLPPWSITHFRVRSTESEYYPFGKPPYIKAISPYRQYASAMNLQAMARISSFPLKIYSVKVDDKMTETEKWFAVQQAQQEFANAGLTNSGKDTGAPNDEVWTAEGLLDIKVESMSTNLDDIADIKLLQDRMISAMNLPNGYLAVGDNNGWGESGKSLMQQHKIFGRTVFTLQQSIVEGLMELVKMHFTLKGEFEDEEFTISMPYPVIEETSDRERMKSDSLRLATDILSNLGQNLGLERDEALPIEIVKDVFMNHSFLEPEEVDRWIKEYEKAQEAKEEDDTEESSGGGFGGRFKASTERKNSVLRSYFGEGTDSRVEKETRKKLVDIAIEEANERSKRKNMEGVRNSRHFISSSVPNDKNLDVKLKVFKDRFKKLKETNSLKEKVKPIDLEKDFKLDTHEPISIKRHDKVKKEYKS